MQKKELTVDDVWKMIADTNRIVQENSLLMKETDKQIKENSLQMKETDRRMQETDKQIKETDKQLKETDRQVKETALQMKETDRQVKETSLQIKRLNKEFGDLSKNIGLHAEQYFQNALGESLVFGGLKYDKMIPNLKYHHKNINAEFDIVLVNGKSTALIEAKNRISPNFVKELAEKKIANFKKYFPEFCKSDVYLGIAGFSFDENVLSEAKERGIGVIRQVGKSIEISKNKLVAY